MQTKGFGLREKNIPESLFTIPHSYSDRLFPQSFARWAEEPIQVACGAPEQDDRAGSILEARFHSLRPVPSALRARCLLPLQIPAQRDSKMKLMTPETK